MFLYPSVPRLFSRPATMERRLLRRGAPVRLDEVGLILRVLDGTVWLTTEGRDVILRSGETTLLPRGGTPSVVEAVEGSAVIVLEGVRS